MSTTNTIVVYNKIIDLERNNCAPSVLWYFYLPRGLDKERITNNVILNRILDTLKQCIYSRKLVFCGGFIV